MLFDCTRYVDERERLRGAVQELIDGIYEYQAIKRYHMGSDEIEKRINNISGSDVEQ